MKILEILNKDKYVKGCIRRNETIMNCLRNLIDNYKVISPELCAMYVFNKYKEANKPVTYNQFRTIKHRLKLEFPKGFFQESKIGVTDL